MSTNDSAELVAPLRGISAPSCLNATSVDGRPMSKSLMALEAPAMDRVLQVGGREGMGAGRKEWKGRGRERRRGGGGAAEATGEAKTRREEGRCCTRESNTRVSCMRHLRASDVSEGKRWGFRRVASPLHPALALRVPAPLSALPSSSFPLASPLCACASVCVVCVCLCCSCCCCCCCCFLSSLSALFLSSLQLRCPFDARTVRKQNERVPHSWHARHTHQ